MLFEATAIMQHIITVKRILRFIVQFVLRVIISLIDLVVVSVVLLLSEASIVWPFRLLTLQRYGIFARLIQNNP